SLCSASVERLAVDLAEHDVERTENGSDVGEHMPARHEIHRLEMGKPRRPDLAAVGPVGAVGDEVDAELTLGAFGGDVDLAGGHVESFSIELEVVNHGFHRLLHLAAFGRHDLAVARGDRK